MSFVDLLRYYEVTTCRQLFIVTYYLIMKLLHVCHYLVTSYIIIKLYTSSISLFSDLLRHYEVTACVSFFYLATNCVVLKLLCTSSRSV